MPEIETRENGGDREEREICRENQMVARKKKSFSFE
jgi:hypothetical protein